MNFTYIVYVYYDAKVKSQAVCKTPMENVGPFKTRREEYADATREALVTAAGELFTSEGYQQVGIEAIARKARVTRGAFYHHFDSKDELYAAAVASFTTCNPFAVKSAQSAPAIDDPSPTNSIRSAKNARPCRSSTRGCRTK